jgi:hypothetical protein
MLLSAAMLAGASPIFLRWPDENQFVAAPVGEYRARLSHIVEIVSGRKKHPDSICFSLRISPPTRHSGEAGLNALLATNKFSYVIVLPDVLLPSSLQPSSPAS